MSRECNYMVTWRDEVEWKRGGPSIQNLVFETYQEMQDWIRREDAFGSILPELKQYQLIQLDDEGKNINVHK